MKYFFTTLFASLIAISANAQFRASIFGVYSQPIFKMQTQGYDNGGGIGFGGSFKVVDIDFFELEVGGELFASGNGTVSGDSPIGKYSLSNSFTGGVLQARLIDNRKDLKPYGGLHYSRLHYTTWESVPGYGGNLYETSTDNVGFSLGLIYQPVDFFFFDAGVEFNYGGKADFVELKSFESENLMIDYNDRETNSSMLIFKVGIGFRIFSSDLGSMASNDYYYNGRSYSGSTYSSDTYSSGGSCTGSTSSGNTSTTDDVVIIKKGNTPVGVSGGTTKSKPTKKKTIVKKGKTPVGLK